MSNFMDTYFGPLNKDSCVYFFILSFIFFILLFVALSIHIFFYFKNFKQLNLTNIMNTIIIIFNIFIVYFVNRLLYTMCNKSLA
jgi:hypothetical protein